jgi:hypothetical protein
MVTSPGRHARPDRQRLGNISSVEDGSPGIDLAKAEAVDGEGRDSLRTGLLIAVCLIVALRLIARTSWPPWE